eukprot:gene11841-35672_t
MAGDSSVVRRPSGGAAIGGCCGACCGWVLRAAAREGELPDEAERKRILLPVVAAF